MRKTNRKPYAGYKRAHLYSAIGTIVLGLCLIIAVIIMAVNFKVEIKVDQQPVTTAPVQQQPVVEDKETPAEDPQIEEIPTEEIPAVEEITPTEEPTTEEITPVEETPVTTPVIEEPVIEEPVIEEPVIAEPTTETPTEEAEVEMVTVLVTVNFYNNGCTTKTVEIRTEANTILTKADIKILVAKQYPAWGRVSSTGLPTEFTATDGAKVPGTVKLYLVQLNNDKAHRRESVGFTDYLTNNHESTNSRTIQTHKGEKL